MRHSTTKIVREPRSRRHFARRDLQIPGKSEQTLSVHHASAFCARDPGATIRILIADDLEEWRVQIRKLLSARFGWDVIAEACDGLQALQKTVELSPDIVLLDIGMPIMNGLRQVSKFVSTVAAATSFLSRRAESRLSGKQRLNWVRPDTF